MATYGDDLTLITDAESADTWAEADTYVVGDVPAEGENDYYIQGLSCASTDTNNKTGLASGIVDAGSDISGSFTDGSTVVLIWHVFLPGNGMDTFDNGGYRAIVGSATTTFGAWKVGGNDFSRNPYGGWHCYAVDPSKTPDYAVNGWTAGTSGSGYRWFGAATNLTAEVNKGTMHAWDAMRYGRGEIYCTGTGCTFTGLEQYNSYNDAVNGYNRLGLFQAQGGIYLWKGLMSLGQSGTSCTFSDSNKTIIIDDTPAVYSSFNRIAIRNASSSVTWSNITIQALGTTSPGELEVVEDATVNFDGCTFQNMNTFTFLSKSTVTNSIFNICGQVDGGGGTFTNTKVLSSSVVADASAFKWDVNTDTDGKLDNMTFSKGTNAHHAIELGTTSPTEVTLNGWTLTGFNPINGENDSAIYVARTSGTVTINVVGGSGNFTYKSAGADVNIVIDPVAFSVSVRALATGFSVHGSRVLAEVASSSNFHCLTPVSIVRSGEVAYVSHASHSVTSGQYMRVRGTDQPEYRGARHIIYTGPNSYHYVVSGSPDSPATGTPNVTQVLINGETDVDGEISDTRSYSVANQPFSGIVRRGTSSPYYVAQPITGTISKDAGLSIIVQLASDE